MVNGGWWMAKSAVLGFPQVEHLFKTVDIESSLDKLPVPKSPTPPVSQSLFYSAGVGLAAVAATFSCARFSRFLRSASARSAMTASIWTSLSRLLR